MPRRFHEKSLGADHMGLAQTPKVDYMNLPPPCRYEDMQREIMSESWLALPHSRPTPNALGCLMEPSLAVALKPDLFEGLRFEVTRPLNQNFFLTHR